MGASLSCLALYNPRLSLQLLRLQVLNEQTATGTAAADTEPLSYMAWAHPAGRPPAALRLQGHGGDALWGQRNGCPAAGLRRGQPQLFVLLKSNICRASDAAGQAGRLCLAAGPPMHLQCLLLACFLPTSAPCPGASIAWQTLCFTAGFSVSETRLVMLCQHRPSSIAQDPPAPRR